MTIASLLIASVNLTLFESLDLAVNAALPIALVFLGYVIQRSQAKNNHRQSISLKLIEKRIEVLSNLGPKINDLYCFFTWKGHWRQISPEQAIATKREIGTLFHVNRFLFSDDLSPHYKAFVDLCFLRDRGPDLDAGLKTNIVSRNGDRKKHFGPTWNPAWDELFFPCDHDTSVAAIDRAYDTLMHAFRRELDAVRDKSHTHQLSP